MNKNNSDPWNIPDKVEVLIPNNWVKKPNKKTRKGKEGFRWEDLQNQGNGIRIDRGDPQNNQISQQVDHVVVRHNGKVVGRDGKPISGKIKEDFNNAHIPLDEWQNWQNWHSP